MLAANQSATAQAALLYRRDNSTGMFVYRRTLQSRTGTFQVGEVAMRNGIAAIRWGNEVTIYEHSGGDYVRGRSAAPIRHPGGLAISGNSILVGGNDCDYDAVVYQKGADGNWGITGRMDDNQGECHPEGRAVELNNDYALLRVLDTNNANAWRRNSTALNWIPAGTLNVVREAVSDRPYALSNSTAVAPGNFVFRRDGNTWTQTGRALPVNFDNSFGIGGFDVVYRDGVLVTSEAVVEASPYAYLETSPGRFEHVAIMSTSEITVHHDVSGHTVVAAIQDAAGSRFGVQVFDLPAPLRAPPPVVNDFEDRDISGLTFSGGQFALARRGSDDVLEQSHANGLAVALVNDSDWTDLQRVEVDITATLTGDSWVGAVARYIDADNYYYVAVRGNDTYGLYKRVNGVTTLLSEGAWFSAAPTLHLAFTVDDNDNMTVGINNEYFTSATDKSLRHGRAGLATSFARADFDDVHVAATNPMSLLTKNYAAFGSIRGREFTEIGGNWEILLDEEGNHQALAQLNANGNALAVIGIPVANQQITSVARIGSFNSSQTSSWFGLLARYVDSRNYYSVAVRSNNHVQIRKQVNGVITVLAAAPFTALPGQFHEFRFRVINDQLQLFLDGVLVASAHDGDIARGQYGIGTHYASAVWESVFVGQP